MADTQKYEIISFSQSRVCEILKNKKYAFAIISAYRGNTKENINVSNSRKLREWLRAEGYGYVEMQGGYVETDEDGNKIPVVEVSFLITTLIEDAEQLKEDMLFLAQKYKQDSFFFKADDFCGYILSNGKEINEAYKRLSFVVEKYFSKIRKGHNRAFTFVAEKDRNFTRAVFGASENRRIFFGNVPKGTPEEDIADLRHLPNAFCYNLPKTWRN